MMRIPADRVTRGLLVLGALSVLDVLGPVLLPAPGPDEAGPPPWINAFTAILGLVSLLLIAVYVREGGRNLLTGLVGCRVLSALTGLPAFFVSGVPVWAVALAAVFLVLTAVGCGYLAPALRSRA